MNYLICLLFFLSHQGMSSFINNRTSQGPGNLEFIDSYPVKVDGEASFFTYDTAKLATGNFVFIVSGSGTAFFKKGGKIVMANRAKRQVKQNGYIDHFVGSDYQITLNVSKDKKVSEGRTRYTGILKLAQKNKVINVAVHGINEEYKLNFP